MLANKKLYDRCIQFWSEMLDKFLLEDGSIPVEFQPDIAIGIHSLVIDNLDNKNHHLYEDEEEIEFLHKLGSILERIDDAVLLDRKLLPIKQGNSNCYRWVYLILKYRNPDLEFDFWTETDPVTNATTDVYGYNNIPTGKLYDLTVNILFMEVANKTLHIDGTISPIALMNNSSFVIYCGDKYYTPTYTERYSHTKAFGTSIFKRRSFSIDIPLTGRGQNLQFRIIGTWGSEDLCIELKSHFSRISKRFDHSYWKISKNLVMLPRRSSLQIKRRQSTFFREFLLWIDMLKTGDKKIIKYIPVRMYLHSRKLWKRHPIWLFLDKIYKAGDSSEYIYRYAREQEDGIQKYYLVSESSPDYKRLRDDGIEPLTQWSLKHRLVFLAADMIIISNSTVYAFNDMSLENTSYIRDLMNFHTVCVQHGMSVQKIAVAQNRLRDNIRLYFCASRYEIENLSKPVYDYSNTDVLKLTGVPRYDGLVNQDKKQIMISPTWRMQAAVTVSKNEGVARDYNPMFRESAYFKVFNSLINDPRLISAAEQYGYRIAYVLHPIVSPQVDDFDKNDYVDIIPDIGDMSYEKMFCESSLMVTDFSGIQFDFAYMRKPLVYLHHKDIPQHYEEGTFHYDSMAFGEICHDNDELIELLCDYMKNDCQMKDEYVRRADDFFAFNDHNNCQRIYDIMLDYQKQVIDKK